MLLQVNGEEVTDFSWTFHKFYADQGLFGMTKIDLHDNKLCFPGVNTHLIFIRRNMLLLALKCGLQKVDLMAWRELIN
jgi:hypothetical protein